MTRFMELFPASEEGHDPYREIAHKLGCHDEIVARAFRGLEVPEWANSTHLNATRNTTHLLNEAARHAASLLSVLRRLSDQEQQLLHQAGAVTSYQIEHLVVQLTDDANDLGAWDKRFDRTGGRNPASTIVAEGIRRVFRRLRRAITFGQHPDGGPSTEFGRTVQFGLGAFGVRSDWRRPAQAAVDRHREMSNRLNGCLAAAQERLLLGNPPVSLDMKGISILTYREENEAKFLIKMDDHEGVVPLSVPSRMFKSGKEVQAFALDWALRNGLKRG